jgi:hypothetical protein
MMLRKITNSMEPSPSFQATSCAATNFPTLYGMQRFIAVPTKSMQTGQYPQPDQASPVHPMLPLQDPS